MHGRVFTLLCLEAASLSQSLKGFKNRMKDKELDFTGEIQMATNELVLSHS